MPFDIDHKDRGENDPEHNRDGLRAVAFAAVTQVDLNAEMNGLCKRCARNMAMTRLITANLADVEPAKIKAAAEVYRQMLNSLLNHLIESA